MKKIFKEKDNMGIRSDSMGLLECYLNLPQLSIIISKKQVESGDVTDVIGALKTLIQSPEIARSFMEKVDISFNGYGHDPRELHQIPEVRDYIHKLDAQFNFWLYFLSKKHPGLRTILYCLLPPDWNKADIEITTKKIDEILFYRWIQALNEIDDFIGRDDDVNKAITERTMKYVQNSFIGIHV